MQHHRSIDLDYDYDAVKPMTSRNYINDKNNINTDMTSNYNNMYDKHSKLSSDLNGSPEAEEEHLDTEEALMDLVQLEEFQAEAERMKAVGNKHMATQDFTKAYHAYSAALQLSPVGPSSHVFLSNRAAALLSLKKYTAAATDARRAIALAPTFGKAHARLGQALYFLKEYEAAVQAYKDAIQFEPDNEVTVTYLEKAKSKLEKQQQKKGRNKEGSSSHHEEAMSVAESTHFSNPNSIATDPQARFGVVQQDQYRGVQQGNAVMQRAVSGTMNSLAKTKEQARQRALHPHVGGHSSSASIAASAITMDSEEKLHRNKHVNNSLNDQVLPIGEDPEFEEAIRIQQRANKFLVQKKYRAAIEEYTAALFLVPDDPNLSPDLHLGRAHALNGSRRHESARNDALLAVKLNPTPAAYSTLAKSLFYMKEYAASKDAFEQCIQLLPPGESLGLFDQAYLEKAEKALAEEAAFYGDSASQSRQQVTVPKLPPPRFVPREAALQSQPPSLRPMPKEWPQQPAMQTPPLKCGPEREVVFLSESLGVKLNRGSDGIVRVLSVTPLTASSVVARQGGIQAGDIVREAAGVDIRRPITNVMWGDTVALIKMAPRPISFLVAKELSPVPPAVLEEQKKIERGQNAPQSSWAPSNAIGDESVAAVVAAKRDERIEINESVAENSADFARTSLAVEAENDIDDDIMEIKEVITNDIVEIEDHENFAYKTQNRSTPVTESFLSPFTANSPRRDAFVKERTQNTNLTGGYEEGKASSTEGKTFSKEVTDHSCQTSTVLTPVQSLGESNKSISQSVALDDAEITKVEDASKAPHSFKVLSESLKDVMEADIVEILSPGEEEERIIGGEILFVRDEPSPSSYCEWDTLRWMAYSGTRKVACCQEVHRQFEGEKKRNLFSSLWKTGGKHYEPRALAVYEEPSVIMVLRRPSNFEELCQLVGLSEDASNEDRRKAIHSYWITESVAEPETAKLRLSSLTTITSLTDENADDRDRSCFQVLTPVETIILSAVKARQNQSFKDSVAFLETLTCETLISKTLCSAHGHSPHDDIAWKHQIVVGSLHSLVLSGNSSLLADAIEYARKASAGGLDAGMDSRYLPARMIDALDENGFSALYYACKTKMSSAVDQLVKAGADVTTRFGPNKTTPCHISARNLDDKSLLSLLSKTNPSRPGANSLDNECKTPMYVAATEGSILDGGRDPGALGRCITALSSQGGQMVVPGTSKTLRHPVSVLASLWLPEYLAVVLDHLPFRYPLRPSDNFDLKPGGASLSAIYHYPVHFALLSLRNEFPLSLDDELAPESRAVRTLRVLFEHGFEPNERIECPENSLACFDELKQFVGFAPIQILALLSLEVESLKTEDTPALQRKADLMKEIAEFLIRHGARMSLEPPPLQRQRKNITNKSAVSSQRSNVLPGKIDSNKLIVSLLGGETILEKGRKDWAGLGKVEVKCTNFLGNTTSSFDDADAPGGSDSLSCAICWCSFGAIMNRKHKCRVSCRYVCDECSSKRLIQNGTEHRVSDGQFLLGRVDAFKKVQLNVTSENHVTKHRNATSAALAAARLDRLEAEEQSKRDTLFGGFLEKATSFVMGEEEDENTSGKLEGLTTSLNMTRDALNQRGEKLSALNEKSAQLVDASADFAKMAKELRKQSEGGFFW